MSRRTSERRLRVGLGAAVIALAWCASRAHAKELDQFTDRLVVLAYYSGGYRAIEGAPGPAQTDEILDRRMNELMSDLERELRESTPQTPRERDELVRAAFQHPLLPELVTPYEEWVKHEAPVPLYKIRDKGIYGYAVDYDDMRMSWYIELSPILQVAGVTIGIDKLGHFLAQGFQYYEHALALDPRLSPAARAAAMRSYGHTQEVGSLGIATTGVYSFADLAANWQGMLFFQALFDDVQSDGKRIGRYFARDSDGRYRRVRDFHWADWLSHDWDEVLNPSATQTERLYQKMVDNFHRTQGTSAQRLSICAQYRAQTGAFMLVDRQIELRPRERYTEPAAAARSAPHPIDIRVMCRGDGL